MEKHSQFLSCFQALIFIMNMQYNHLAIDHCNILLAGHGVNVLYLPSNFRARVGIEKSHVHKGQQRLYNIRLSRRVQHGN